MSLGFKVFLLLLVLYVSVWAYQYRSGAIRDFMIGFSEALEPAYDALEASPEWRPPPHLVGELITPVRGYRDRIAVTWLQEPVPPPPPVRWRDEGGYRHEPDAIAYRAPAPGAPASRVHANVKPGRERSATAAAAAADGHLPEAAYAAAYEGAYLEDGLSASPSESLLSQAPGLLNTAAVDQEGTTTLAIGDARHSPPQGHAAPEGSPAAVVPESDLADAAPPEATARGPEEDLHWSERSEGFSEIDYLVQQNDKLWKIAEKYFGDGLEYKRIQRWNDLADSDSIQAGMKLKLRIPRQETRREEALRRAADAAAATPTPREVRYRIQEADNLGYIAGRFYGNRDLWRRVYDANTDILENPDRLPVGLELRIPDPVAPR